MFFDRKLFTPLLILVALAVTACPGGGDDDDGRDGGNVPTCGNGVLDRAEQCDPEIASGTGACPATCDDGDACTSDTLLGSAEACTAECSSVTITQCAGADGCCPSACNATNDSDCAGTCGNGVVETGEKCDGDCPGACTAPDACTTATLVGSAGTCSAECTTTAITQCVHGDGCCAPGCNVNNDNDCAPVCGNNQIEPGETCDGANCPTSCTSATSCVLSVLTGSALNCTAECVITNVTECTSGDNCCPTGCDIGSDTDCSGTCGNGTVEGTEKCDGNCPGTCTAPDVCSTSTLIGSALNCSAECVVGTINQCIGGDGCCAPGCSAATDSDCGGTGSACTVNADCNGGLCITSVSSGWNQGYCTAPCDTATTCAPGSHCGFMEDTDNDQIPDTGLCLQNCATANDCRTPYYGCYDLDDAGVAECAPVANGTKAVGDTCANIHECSGGELGSCARDSSGWKNGYCMRSCDNANPCPGGSHCAEKDAQGTGVCLKDCTTATDCRNGDGYLCVDIEATPDNLKECIAAATGTKAAGEACGELYECSGGLDGFCFDRADGFWRDGYCSRSCTATSCPAGSHCGFLSDRDKNAATPDTGYCMANCTTTCSRSGYTCQEWDGVTTTKECLPEGTSPVGGGCNFAYDCANTWFAYCLDEANYGMTGGYCLVDCTAGSGTSCPGGSFCSSELFTGMGVCVDQCQSATECRSGEGYDCYAFTDAPTSYGGCFL